MKFSSILIPHTIVSCMRLKVDYFFTQYRLNSIQLNNLSSELNYLLNTHLLFTFISVVDEIHISTDCTSFCI